MKEQPVKYKTSTAGFTCFTRACAVREDISRFRGSDDMAQIFLPAFASVILHVPFLRRVFMHKVAPSGIYEYVIARTKIFDRYFLEALQDGVSQIVILGAGMDTRALRFAAQNMGTRIFEVDQPGVQQSKLQILRRKNVLMPVELVFVPMDFNTQDLGLKLAAAGFKTNQRTLFLWEGVCMYLQADAVDRMLAFIHGAAGQDSMIVFDYVLASVLRKEHKLYGEEQIYTTVAGTGEGWRFGIEEGMLGPFLAQRGYHLLKHYTSQDMQREFLTGEDGSMFGCINGMHHIASAKSIGKNEKMESKTNNDSKKEF